MSLDGSEIDGSAEGSLDTQQMNLKASAFIPSGSNNEHSSPSVGSYPGSFDAGMNRPINDPKAYPT